jgi:hypothetical protein
VALTYCASSVSAVLSPELHHLSRCVRGSLCAAPARHGVRHAGRSEAAHAPAGAPRVWAHDAVPQPSGGAALTARCGTARAPWAQGLADEFGLDRLSPPARCPLASPRARAGLWLGASGYLLRENVPRAGDRARCRCRGVSVSPAARPAQWGSPRHPARHLCGPHPPRSRGVRSDRRG